MILTIVAATLLFAAVMVWFWRTGTQISEVAPTPSGEGFPQQPEDGWGSDDRLAYTTVGPDTDIEAAAQQFEGGCKPVSGCRVSGYVGDVDADPYAHYDDADPYDQIDPPDEASLTEDAEDTEDLTDAEADAIFAREQLKIEAYMPRATKYVRVKGWRG